MRHQFILAHAAARAGAVQAVQDAPDGYVVEIKDRTRSLEQNAKLHAALTDISKQVEWYGKKFDVVTWKRLCVASWLREKKRKAYISSCFGWEWC